MKYFMVDQHIFDQIRLTRNRWIENIFSCFAGMSIWLVLMGVMGWAIIDQPQPTTRPYLSYPDHGALLKHTKEQISKLDRAFIDEMEITSRMKTKEVRRK
jgi:hypothetical protein